jgi:hypothetical protein
MLFSNRVEPASKFTKIKISSNLIGTPDRVGIRTINNLIRKQKRRRSEAYLPFTIKGLEQQ